MVSVVDISVTLDEGCSVGSNVGSEVGSAVGCVVGVAVRNVGDAVGS